MSIISSHGTRLVTGIGALAIAGSVAAGSGAAAAPKGDDHHAVRELRHELRDQSKPEREAIVALRKSMAEEYAKDEPDYERMRALQAEIDGHEARIATMRQEAFVAMHDTLTPEQRRRVADNMAAGPKGDKKGKRGEKPEKGKKDKKGEDRLTPKAGGKFGAAGDFDRKPDSPKPKPTVEGPETVKANGGGKGKSPAKRGRKAT